MENKLTIEQLKNYLGTGLKFYKKDHVKLFPKNFDVMEMKGLDFFCNEVLLIESVSTGGACKNIYLFEQKYRPAFFQLSDLDKFIPELGFVPLEMIRAIRDNDTIGFDGVDFIFDSEGDISYDGGYSFEITKQACRNQFSLLQQLFKWHFWPFGDEYFEQGLVIDKLKHGN